MLLFIQNLAHLSHGMLLCFFLMGSVELLRRKDKSRLHLFLAAEMVFWTLVELKDLAYLHEPWWEDYYISTTNLSIDLWAVPATILLMFEVLSPGWVRPRRVAWMLLPFVLFTLAFVVTRSPLVFYVAAGCALVQGTLSLALVWIGSRRYDRFIRSNFSYVENLDVRWMRVFVTLLYAMLVLWVVAYLSASWAGDVVFYLSVLVLWYFIFHHIMKHHTIDVPNLLNPFAPIDAPGTSADACSEEGAPEADPALADDLARCMEQDKMYLNPKLTMADVSNAIGTNRTYLSDYINRGLGTTFYEYVNAYRVREAAMLLLTEPALPLREVADRCGFGSLSTFHRSFARRMGLTPTEYRVRELNLPPP